MSVMSKLSIKDLDLKDKTVFIRVDFNVPLQRAAGRSRATSASGRLCRPFNTRSNTVPESFLPAT